MWLKTGKVEDGYRAMAKRIATGNWWLLIAYDQEGIALAGQIEQAYFLGDKSVDFEITMIPLVNLGFSSGLLSIFQARKKHLPAQELSAFLHKTGGSPITAQQLQKHDCIVITNDKPLGALVLDRFCQVMDDAWHEAISAG